MEEPEEPTAADDAGGGGQSSSHHAARKAEDMPPQGRQPRYDNWTLEELRALAAELRVPEADSRSRAELIEMLSRYR